MPYFQTWMSLNLSKLPTCLCPLTYVAFFTLTLNSFPFFFGVIGSLWFAEGRTISVDRKNKLSGVMVLQKHDIVLSEEGQMKLYSFNVIWHSQDRSYQTAPQTKGLEEKFICKTQNFMIFWMLVSSMPICFSL